MAEGKLSAAQRSKIRRLSVHQEMAPEDVGGELNIVPFLDMVVNILMFVLATVAVTFTATFESTPPSAGGKGVRAAEKTLNLTLVITNEGVSIKAAGGNIATGCDGVGPGITVPAQGRDEDGQPRIDAASITSCAKKLKDQSPDFKEETQIRITASNNIAYKTVVDCIDAVRRAPDGADLFKDVLFSVPR